MKKAIITIISVIAVTLVIITFFPTECQILNNIVAIVFAIGAALPLMIAAWDIITNHDDYI